MKTYYVLVGINFGLLIGAILIFIAGIFNIVFLGINIIPLEIWTTILLASGFTGFSFGMVLLPFPRCAVVVNGKRQ